MKFYTLAGLLLLLAYSLPSQAQDKKTTAKAFEGIFVAGYVDRGAFINCTGPAIKYNTLRYSVLLGLLPSIKIKEDTAPVKNSLFTPTLGFGATITIFKHLAIQVPVFYIPKTANTNGRWRAGAGIGYKM